LVAGITLGARGFGFYSVAESGITPVMEVLSYLVPGLLIILFGALAVTGRTLTIPKSWARLNDRLLEAVSARLARWNRTQKGGQSA
jgi:lipopolysaccharide export system permease protein